jgi:hypothetical protein
MYKNSSNKEKVESGTSHHFYYTPIIIDNSAQKLIIVEFGDII